MGMWRQHTLSLAELTADESVKYSINDRVQAIHSEDTGHNSRAWWAVILP